MENVQPLKLGKVLSNSFKLLGKDFLKMFLSNAVCAFIILIPVAVLLVNMLLDPTRLFMGFNTRSFKPENPYSIFLLPQILIPYVAIFILAFLVSPFMSGIPLVLSSSRLHGKPLKFKEAFLQVGHKYGRLLATSVSGFVLLLPLLALYFWAYFGMMNSMFGGLYRYDYQSLGGAMMMMPLMFLLGMIYYAVMLYLGLVLHYSTCITVNEENYAFRAIFRGFALVGKSGFWRNIGHYIVFALILFGAAIVFAIFVSIFTVSMAFSPVLVPAFGILCALMIMAFSAAIQSLTSIYVQLMYFNSRIITEGYGFGE